MKYDDKLHFVYNGSDGVEREIKPGVGSRVVTYENREEFCDVVSNNRLREFEKQVLAIERGMSEVISGKRSCKYIVDTKTIKMFNRSVNVLYI